MTTNPQDVQAQWDRAFDNVRAKVRLRQQMIVMRREDIVGPVRRNSVTEFETALAAKIEQQKGRL
jgi:hypothetical protein